MVDFWTTYLSKSMCKSHESLFSVFWVAGPKLAMLRSWSSKKSAGFMIKMNQRKQILLNGLIRHFLSQRGVNFSVSSQIHPRITKLDTIASHFVTVCTHYTLHWIINFRKLVSHPQLRLICLQRKGGPPPAPALSMPSPAQTCERCLMMFDNVAQYCT